MTEIFATGGKLRLLVMSLVLLFSLAAAAAAQTQDVGEAPGLGTQWQPPAGGFGAFLTGLGDERYMGLVFRRVGRDLLAGDAHALNVFFSAYFNHRKARDAAVPDTPAPELMLLEGEVRAGLQSAAGSGILTVPPQMLDAVIIEARRIAGEVYGLPFAQPPPPSDRIEGEAVHAGQAESQPRRVEDSGLLRDAADFVRQPHLLFLFGGAGPEAVGRLVAELMRIARADGLVADRESVAVFVERLAEAGAIEAGQRDAVLAAAFAAGRPSANRGEGAPEPGTETPSLAPEVPQGETPAAPDLPEEKPDVPGVQEQAAPDVPLEYEEVPGDDEAAGALHGDVPPYQAGLAGEPGRENAPADPNAAPPSGPQPHDAVPQGRSASVRIGGSEFVWTFEGALGVAIPASRDDAGATGLTLERDAGVAARLAFGAVWPRALGRADLGVGLVGVAGRTGLDGLDTAAGTLGLDGSGNYVGVLPWLSAELPIADGLSLRGGGGLGIAYRDVNGTLAGGGAVDGDGAALMVQFGAGLRQRIAACVDAGIDVYATRLGAVDGRIGAQPATFEASWDIAVLAGVRFALGGDGGTCR